VGEESTPSNNLVTEDHCTQVSLRIEGKVGGLEGKVDRLVAILEPKLEMIVRIDNSFKWVKGIALFVGSGGFIAGVYKVIVYISKQQ